MGWAQQRVARIKAEQEAITERQTRASEARAVVSNNANDLWELLASALQKETQEFADGLPLAKEKNLRADRLNSNNVTISTQVFPIIRLQIVYTRGSHVDGDVTKTYHGLGQTTAARLQKIKFTVDSDMQPCFTDGARYLSPAQVAEEIMETVADFFETALKLPKYLA